MTGQTITFLISLALDFLPRIQVLLEKKGFIQATLEMMANNQVSGVKKPP
jgi:hypothetical protein